MSNITNINYRRRQFLQYTAFGALTAALPGLVLSENRVLNNKPNSAFKADVEIDLIARPTEVAILSGKHTRVFQYHGKLIKGPQAALKTVPGYLGPIFSFQKGQKIRINFYNQLSELCITHWHGLHVPQIMDGHPMYAISHGERYVYEFEIKNPAGTNWYHSHTHELTGAQVYQGLAGMIIISDDVEQKLELPSGEYDLPIIIQDRNFTHDNQLSFNLRRHDRTFGEVEVRSRLLGLHNVENLLVALAIALALDIVDPADAARALGEEGGAPGRLERCDEDADDVRVLVDYAHTPDALARALDSLAPFRVGRVICVFGCGGDRDPTKRAPMGSAAGRGADLAVVTSDNPRGEAPEAIAEAVEVGVRAAGLTRSRSASSLKRLGATWWCSIAARPSPRRCTPHGPEISFLSAGKDTKIPKSWAPFGTTSTTAWRRGARSPRGGGPEWRRPSPATGRASPPPRWPA
ncbi:MAG: multicopper oxidase domain-containing protein [Nitrosomonas sp.]